MTSNSIFSYILAILKNCVVSSLLFAYSFSIFCQDMGE